MAIYVQDHAFFKLTPYFNALISPVALLLAIKYKPTHTRPYRTPPLSNYWYHLPPPHNPHLRQSIDEHRYIAAILSIEELPRAGDDIWTFWGDWWISKGGIGPVLTVQRGIFLWRVTQRGISNIYRGVRYVAYSHDNDSRQQRQAAKPRQSGMSTPSAAHKGSRWGG